MILDDFGGLDEAFVWKVSTKPTRKNVKTKKIYYESDRMRCLIWNPGKCKHSDEVWRAHTELVRS